MQKIKNSLLFPRNLALYSKDKFGKVLLYLIFLLALIILPSIIDIYTTPLLDNLDLTMIRNSFYDAESVNCLIADNELKCDEDKPYLVNIDDLNVSTIFYPSANKDVISTLENRKTVVLTFEKTRVTFKIQSNIPGFSFMNYELVKYSEVEAFNGLDFTKAKDRVNDQFWNQFDQALIGSLKPFESSIRLSMLILSTIQSIVILLTSVLMVAVLLRIYFFAIPITFGEIFRIVTYSFTGYALLSLISILYNLGWMINLAMIIPMIYSYLAIVSYVRFKMLKQ